MELAAALLLSELLSAISKTDLPFTDFLCWSDSMVALSWIRNNPAKFNVFVANRVRQIQTLTNSMNWHHVQSTLNPADILSRGCTPMELLQSRLWREGPPFLLEEPVNWPRTPDSINQLPECHRVRLVSSQLDLSISCKYHNSFPKLQRIFAYIYFLCYKRKLGLEGPLTTHNIKGGTQLIIRHIQQIHFSNESHTLLSGNQLHASSKLRSLNPFLDSHGILRVGGRLQNSALDLDAKHPMVHPETNGLIMHFHRKYLHAGPQSLLAFIRQQYWPIGGRKTVSAIINKCVICFRSKPKIAEHIMGNLPSERVQASRAFITTGVDFCGPLYYKSEIRNHPLTKCYASIFVCFSTKASHIELVSDLSTPSFLATLKRFICSREKPQTIWSDNATNFVGAKKKLEDLERLFLSSKHIEMVSAQCLSDGIDWRFVPLRSPNFGGLWEAAVKSFKLHFLRAVGNSLLNFEELRTLVCEISAILNSRPVSPMSENPRDLEVLTPAHFLVGAPLTALMEPDVTNLNVNRLNRWQRVCYLQQIFWKKWSSSYLSLLQERNKWRAATKTSRRAD